MHYVWYQEMNIADKYVYGANMYSVLSVEVDSNNCIEQASYKETGGLPLCKQNEGYIAIARLYYR
jgi:hypothetical protein